MNKIHKNEKGFSILEGIFIAVVIIVIVFVGGIVYIAHSLSVPCGEKAPAYKTELNKIKVFNTVSIVPGQPNRQASIYNSTDGTCNIDLAQSYSATKSYSVNMTGATAINTVTDNLSKQGFTDTGERYNEDGCSNVTGDISYGGKGIVIDVSFDQATNNKCPAQGGGGSRSIQYPDFITHTVTSIKATVSTPDT